jgi:hypothetical protein
MADKKISALTAATTPLIGTEVLPIVQSGATVKVSVDNLTAGRNISAQNITYTGTLANGVNAISPFTGFKNRFINGNMTIDQRNAGASVSVATAFTFGTDRWRCEPSVSAKLNMQQNAGAVTPPAGYKNYLGLTSTSAYSVSASDYFWLQQFVEGFNIADLGWGTADAQPVTLSFWVRSSLTGAFGASFANSAVDRIYPFNYTISAANTWEFKTVTVPGDTSGTWLTDSGIGLRLNLSLGTGSTRLGSSSAWGASDFRGGLTGATSVVGTSGATFYITGVQLEEGSSATTFEFRSIGTELSLCQRYCYVTNGSVSVTGPVIATNSQISQRFVFPVPFRASPTAVINTSGSYVVSDDRIADYTAATFTIVNTALNTLASKVDIGGFVALPILGTMLCGVPNLGTGRISFSAEL